MYYFLYSETQKKERNQILANRGKRFVPGIVTTNGKRMEFTQLSTSPTIGRFIDTKIIYSVENLSGCTYIKPYNADKEGE